MIVPSQPDRLFFLNDATGPEDMGIACHLHDADEPELPEGNMELLGSTDM